LSIPAIHPDNVPVVDTSIRKTGNLKPSSNAFNAIPLVMPTSMRQSILRQGPQSIGLLPSELNA